MLEGSIIELNLGSYSHDKKIVTFEDQPVGYTGELPNSDGIFQIGVGYDLSVGLRFKDRDRDNPKLLISKSKSSELFLDMYPFDDSDKKEVNKTNNTWKSSITNSST